MGRTTRTIAAGFSGAVLGLIALTVAGAIMVALPTLLAGLAQSGPVAASASPQSIASATQNSTVNVEGSAEDSEAVRRALKSLTWSVNDSTLKIIVTSQRDMPENVDGTYAFAENTIRINQDVVRNSVPQGLSFVLAHELGHMYDERFLTETARSEFMAIRGANPQQDWQGANVRWAQRPQEDFAEVFAALAAPSSPVMVQTDGGRIKNRAALSALIARYENTSKAAAAPTAATLPQLARVSVDNAVTNPGILQLAFAFALVCAVVGAFNSMERVAHAA